MERELSPVEPTRARSVRDGLRGGMLRLLGMAALYRFDVLLDPAVARRANGESIRAAARHVASGGASVIFPDGGGGEPGTRIGQDGS